MSTTKTSTAMALIDPEVKKQAEAILKEFGMPAVKAPLSNAKHKELWYDLFQFSFQVN